MFHPIINLTPHPITLRNLTPNGGHSDMTCNSYGVARVSMTPGVELSRILDIPCALYAPPEYGTVEGLPEPDGKHFYIVSLLVGQNPSLRNRDDVFYPGTGPADNCIRDEKGLVKAVTRLISTRQLLSDDPPSEPGVYIAHAPDGTQTWLRISRYDVLVTEGMDLYAQYFDGNISNSRWQGKWEWEFPANTRFEWVC